MKVIYLDWNIFNKLEHLSRLPIEEQPPYRQLEQMALGGRVTAPYSNAHINDLYRGYVKDPAFTPGHLSNISRLTQNLCVTQYWRENAVKWHYRDPADFLGQILEERPPTSFGSLMRSEDFPEVNALLDARGRLLESMPLPAKFTEAYDLDPIFTLMFPRCRTAPSYFSLFEDILSFSNALRTDYALYKSFRKYLASVRQQFPQLGQTQNTLLQDVEAPKCLTLDGLWDEARPKFRPSANPAYDEVVNLFTTTNLKGYRQDERFANLIDDALHTFYAAHCEYFITLDRRCADKARTVYKTLDISTKVMEVPEFVKTIDH